MIKCTFAQTPCNIIGRVARHVRHYCAFGSTGSLLVALVMHHIDRIDLHTQV